MTDRPDTPDGTNPLQPIGDGASGDSVTARGRRSSDRARPALVPGDIVLNGFDLTRDDVTALARTEPGELPVSISSGARSRCQHQRDIVNERWLARRGDSDPAIYGFNTGVGVLKDRQVERERLQEFQKYYIRSHCTGMGDPFDIDTVRAAILVRTNSLASGHSGISVKLLDALLDLINRGIHPVVPQVGSLGASGDLAPLAHVGAVLTGERNAEAYYRGRRYRIRDLPTEAGLNPIELAPKEAMALTNGTSFMLAELVLLSEDAKRLCQLADVAAALSLEAMLGEPWAFDARVQTIRGHRGQELVARNIRSLLDGGEPAGEELRAEYLRKKIQAELERDSANLELRGLSRAGIEEYRVARERVPRVQDAYSLRCVPQVHGASRDALRHVSEVVDQELNAVTDNPLLFAEGDGYRAVSGGNFHGQPLALAADYASIALAEIGSISERRLFRLLDSRLSYGLPSNLTGGEPGINTGLMITQYTAAALVTESKTLAHPASVDTIPSSGSQEDHVSMGLWAARKARQILANSEKILALEVLGAAQGVDLLQRTLGRKRAMGVGTRAAYRIVRDMGIPALDDDRYLKEDIDRIARLVVDPSFLDGVTESLATSLE